MDQYLLGPLARDIVTGAIPQDEQLLFIYARDGELHWDSSLESGKDHSDLVQEDIPEFSNRHLILHPAGTDDELRHLYQRHRDLDELLNLEAYLDTKQSCLDAMQKEGFWQSEDRWIHLALAEYIDRVESALNSCGNLLDRLTNNPGNRPSSIEKLRLLISKQSERLFLLEHAFPEITSGTANDALLQIQCDEENTIFAKQLCEMYQSWSRNRGMRLETLGSPNFWTARVNGFGALTLLLPEHGLHHWAEGKKGDRHSCLVSVTAIEPHDKKPQIELLASIGETARRYQEIPTPLVVDKRRNYRTGRLDLILKGHFDLIDQ